jgi:hypothetical protein
MASACPAWRTTRTSFERRERARQPSSIVIARVGRAGATGALKGDLVIETARGLSDEPAVSGHDDAGLLLRHFVTLSWQRRDVARVPSS